MVVDGIVDDSVVCVAFVLGVSARPLLEPSLPVEAEPFCGTVVAAFDGCVVFGAFDVSSSPHATPTKSATAMSTTPARRVRFMTLLTRK
jgi:hypothetical protein